MTAYVILRKEEGGWVVIGQASARSARSALRERLDGAQQTSEYSGPGEYVAVPERSWRPLTAAVETKQTLRFS